MASGGVCATGISLDEGELALPQYKKHLYLVDR